MADDVKDEAIHYLLTGQGWMLRLSEQLYTLLQQVEALSVLGTPETEEVMQSAYSEMESHIQSISDRLTTLQNTLLTWLMTGKPLPSSSEKPEPPPTAA